MVKDAVRGIWTRYMYNSAENMQSRIIQNDTDSAFQIHADSDWIQKALTEP